MFGTNNEIWLKTKRDFSVFLNTLTSNLCVVRVHAFVAREFSVLQSENLSLRFPTSSVQSMQAYVEDPQETARPQASASASWNSQSSVARRTHTENSRSTLWSYPPRVSRRFRGTLRQFTSRSRDLHLPKGPLVLVLDGLYFRFRGKDWVVYLMAVKPCHQNRAIFLDPVLRKGRENMQGGLTPSQPFHPLYTDVSVPRSPTRFLVLSNSA